MLAQASQSPDADAALFYAVAAIVVALITVIGNLLLSRKTRKDTKHIAKQVGVINGEMENGNGGRESLFELVREMFRSLVHLEYDADEQKDQTIAINQKMDRFGESLDKHGEALRQHIAEAQPIHAWVREQMKGEADEGREA